MDFIRGLFSSQPGLERVNPLGIVLMVAGAILALFAKPKDSAATGRVIVCKVGGLVVACIGALIAIG